MSKLLSANFMRVKKNKPFWGCIIFMLFLGVSLPIAQYMQVEELNQTRQEVYETVLDQQFFTFVMFIGLVASVFCGLFLGTEYSDGTIRNKVVVGHTRNGIYLANLPTSGRLSPRDKADPVADVGQLYGGGGLFVNIYSHSHEQSKQSCHSRGVCTVCLYINVWRTAY